MVLGEPALGVYATQIADLAAKEKITSLFAPSRLGAGGFLFYGTSQTEAIRRMASYVDKIFKGVRPADLPLQSVIRYELIVNQKTAKEIGVTIPPEVLKRADRVIQQFRDKEIPAASRKGD